MASTPIDYYSIVLATVIDLPENTVEARRAVYDHARAVVRRLAAAEPPLSDAEVAAEEAMLERAIARVEAEQAAPDAVPVEADAGRKADAPLAAPDAPPLLPARPLLGIALRLAAIPALIAVGLATYWLVAPWLVTPGPDQPPAPVALAAAPPADAAPEPDPPESGAADFPVALLLPCRLAVTGDDFTQCARAPVAVDRPDRWIDAYGAAYALASASQADAAATAPATSSAPAAQRFASGVAHLGHDEVDQAIADFSEAIRLDPQFADAYVRRGQALFKNGDTDGAMADFNKALSIDPRHPAAYKGRGMARLYKGDNDFAIVDLSRAIQFANAGPSTLPPIEVFYARRTRAQLYERKQLYDSEVADLGAMIDAYRTDPRLSAALRANYGDPGADVLMASVHRLRASVQVKRGNIDGALSDLTAALALDPRQRLAILHERARIEELAGRREDAAADYRRMLDADADSEEAKSGLARLKNPS